MRLAYADPPYPGQAKRHYGKNGDPFTDAAEVDSAELISQLERDFPDGWALSTSASRLPEVLESCPRARESQKNSGRLLSGSGVRIGVWHVTNAAPFPPQRVMWTWEAVIVRGGRWRRRGQEPFVRDVLVSPNLAGWLGGGIIGAKPPTFCRWLFDLLGLEPDDELVDLFPVSGAVTREWEAWRQQPSLFAQPATVATHGNAATAGNTDPA